MITYSLCESFQPENSADLTLVRTNMTEIRKDDLRSKKAQRILKKSKKIIKTVFIRLNLTQFGLHALI